MSKDEDIRKGLRNAGITELVFGTTLLRENAPDLRELIANDGLVRQGSSKGLYLYPKVKTAVAQTRKLFYLVAKELFLYGVPVYVIPLTRLVDAINSEDIYPEAAKVESVSMVFVLDFYEEGAGFPFSTQDAARVRSWVRARFESGKAVSFLSDCGIDRCTAWWPQSFMGFITDNVVVQAVAA